MRMKKHTFTKDNSLARAENTFDERERSPLFFL